MIEYKNLNVDRNLSILKNEKHYNESFAEISHNIVKNKNNDNTNNNDKK